MCLDLLPTVHTPVWSFLLDGERSRGKRQKWPAWNVPRGHWPWSGSAVCCWPDRYALCRRQPAGCETSSLSCWSGVALRHQTAPAIHWYRLFHDASHCKTQQHTLDLDLDFVLLKDSLDSFLSAVEFCYPCRNKQSIKLCGMPSVQNVSSHCTQSSTVECHCQSFDHHKDKDVFWLLQGQRPVLVTQTRTCFDHHTKTCFDHHTKTCVDHHTDLFWSPHKDVFSSPHRQRPVLITTQAKTRFNHHTGKDPF